jgi:hypothetical protein
MEDLKKYLAILAKQSFWILTGLVLIISTVFFYLTKSDLDQSIDARRSSLKTTFDKIQGIEGKVNTHPNEISHNEMQKRLTGLKGDVERAWEFQYERQKEFLTWPPEAFFEPRTLEIFENLRPFESIVPYPIPNPAPSPLNEITRTDRSVYKKYIAPEFPRLASRIGSTWKFDMDLTGSPTKTSSGIGKGAGTGAFGAGDSGGPALGIDEGDQDLVRWSASSQESLASSVLPWFNRAEPPDIHEIYYAQEDIWILRGLMDIIAKTNAGAKENFQTIVKEIEWIVTGPRAFRDAGTLWDAGGMGANPMGKSGASGSSESSSSSFGGGALGSGLGGGKAKVGGASGEGMGNVDPADGRYVDANLQPLSGSQLRGAIKVVNPNGVAKRVQVRMRVKVDERFGRLITECGNGKMMLEVLQVRYNTPSAITSGGGSGSSPGRSGRGSKMGAMMDGGGFGGVEPEAGSRENVESLTSSSGEVSIEIYGLIYLFNPPPTIGKATSADDTETAKKPAVNGNPATNGAAVAGSNSAQANPTAVSEAVSDTTPVDTATPDESGGNAEPGDEAKNQPPADDRNPSGPAEEKAVIDGGGS